MRSISRRKLDPEATRQTILAAAIKLFAEKGCGATSIGDIAVEAGVGKGLVAYHFGTKEQLRQIAMHQRLQPFFDEIEQTLRTGDLPGLIGKRFHFMKANPDLQRCMAWATLEDEISIERSERQERFQDFVRREGVQSGLRPDLDPMLVMIVANMAMDGFFRFRPIAEKLFPEEVARPDIEERFLHALLTMVKPPKPV